MAVEVLSVVAILVVAAAGVWALARKRSRESEASYRALYRSTPIMLHSIDADGRLVEVSDRWLETLGFSRDEVLGRQATEFLTVESRHRAERVCLPEFMKSGVLRNEPLTFRSKDGNAIDVLLSAISERGDGGNLKRSVVVSIDVTALKASRAEFDDLRRSTDLILESAGEGVFGLDASGLVTFVNAAGAAMLGWESEELRGRSPQSMFRHSRANGTPIPDSECPIYATSKDGIERKVVDDVFWRRDGSSFPVEYTSAPIHRDGDLLGAVVVFRDVTERLAAQAALRDSEEQYRGVFEATADGLTIHRLKDAALVAANSAMAEMHGYTREEFETLSPADYVPQESLHLFSEMLAAVRKGEVFRFAAKAQHKDGHLIDVEGHAVQVSYKGEKHALGVARDVSRQREADAQRQRAFEEIERLKDELESERDYLRDEVDVSLKFGEIVGDSPALRQMLTKISSVADTNFNVLIQGESGVGKELVARAICRNSSRCSQTMVKVNCASIPAELFESEFFGHVRGAFTGAHKDRIGRFQLAHRGTLFLDEVGETPSELQGKLLRVLEEGEFERVGEGTTRRVDVRVIAATNRDLTKAVEQGRFRQDLYFRLSVFPLEVPPLRERREDILPLATHFLRLALGELNREPLGLSRFQADALRDYDWPGNIRELRNVIERAVILSPGDRLRLDLALPHSALAPGDVRAPEPPSPTGLLTDEDVRRFERKNLLAALERSGWRLAGVGGAADLLGLKTSTLRYRLKAMGITRPS